jgi:GABA permease
MGFPQSRSLMSAVILIAVLSTLNAAFYVCSRTLFLLARNGDAPGWLIQIDSRSVPTRSLLISALGGLVGVGAAAYFPRGTYGFLVNASGSVMVFLYAMIATAQIKLRHRLTRSVFPAPGVRPGWFPWSSCLALGVMVTLLMAMAVTPSLRPDLYFSGLAILAATGAAHVVHSEPRRAR